MLDGAVEAARLVGNVHGLAWNLLSRANGGARRRRHRDGAHHGAGERRPRRATAERPSAAYAAVALATARLETGDAGRAADLLIESAGGDELR